MSCCCDTDTQTGPEFTKNGELLPLKFPHFKEELLQQNYWNPSDELGRIKIILSEGFPRDSLTVPVERVKNLVTFSFQHAPMGKLLSCRHRVTQEFILIHHLNRYPRVLGYCLAESTYVVPQPCPKPIDARPNTSPQGWFGGPYTFSTPWQ